MGDPIIDLQSWLRTPAGQSLLAWEQRHLDEAVVDLFGYHALQLGLPDLAALRANRMPHRWLADTQASPQVAIISDFTALPFAANSLDLVVLPHTLESGIDPHLCLREVERVLMPEGRVVICGLNPVSLWGWRLRVDQILERWNLGRPFFPPTTELIDDRRLRDWLRLLSFEVESTRFGLYRPAMNRETWFQRLAWMEHTGTRWWPIFGAVYLLVAVKRVHGMRLLKPRWQTVRQRSGSAVSAVGRQARFLGHGLHCIPTERPD